MPTATKTKPGAKGGQAAPARPKLLLIDGHSVAYRAFFALPVENFSTQTGQHTNGVFGFTSMLINVLRDEAPTHVGVAFDVSRTTFRNEIYSEYKANRSESPAEFKGQVDLVKEVLKALNIVYVEAPGFEADDVIGTLTTQARDAGWEVLICTGDRDAFQLVSERGHRPLPAQGRLRPGADDAGGGPGALPRDARPATPTWPRWWGRRATTCRASPGSGPRPRRSGSSSTATSRPSSRTPASSRARRRQAFQERTESVLRNRQINALVRDLDLPVSIDQLERQPWNREATHTLFDGLEFRVLRDRLLEALPNSDELVAEGGFDMVGERLEPAQLGRVARRARRRRADRARRHRALGLGHRRRAGARRSPRRTGPRRTSTSPSCCPTTSRSSPAGWPTTERPRPCTTPRARCSRSGRAAGTSPA